MSGVDANILRRLIALNLPGEALTVVLSIITDIQADDDARRARDLAKTRKYRARGGGNIPEEMRRAVYERDKFQCVYCGSEENLQCDHVVPVSKGGPTTLANLAAACRTCNARKRDRDRKFLERSEIIPRTSSDKSKDIPPHTPLEASKDPEANASGPTQADLERQLFSRGRQVCGKASGGLIASLLKAKQHDVALARSVIETASTKQDPREYVAAALRSSNNGQHASPLMAAFDDLIARTGGTVEDDPPMRDVTPGSRKIG